MAATLQIFPRPILLLFGTTLLMESLSEAHVAVQFARFGRNIAMIVRATVIQDLEGISENVDVGEYDAWRVGRDELVAGR